MAQPGSTEPIEVVLTTLAQTSVDAPTVDTRLNWWDTLTGSGPIGAATLLILVMFSVVSWAIIVHKYFQLRKAARETDAFLTAFWEAKRLDQVYQDSERYANSPVCQMFRAGYLELARLKKRAPEDDFGIENVERSLRRTQNTEVTALESLTPFLATVGSTGPFIGLFGTVWGIMKAFREIGIAGSANLATVAPGISEALIATAAGLAAAIPAVIAYNAFVSRIRVVETEMETFSSDFLNLVKRHYLK
jgi:biopolymer transport protein TolQ